MTRIRDKAHLDRVRELPCCLTLWHVSDARNDAAHIRHHSGMAIKPPDNHVLPLRHQVHMYEHKRGDFWDSAGFPWQTENDPRAWAERLYECTDHAEREALIRDMAARANRQFLTYVLARVLT